MTNKQIGDFGESKASEYLKLKNYKIIKRNYRVRNGEIDIIAKAPDDTLVFIEVKARSNQSYGHALESITPTKLQKIRKTSLFYIYKNQNETEHTYRYDVIYFQNNRMEHLENIY